VRLYAIYEPLKTFSWLSLPLFIVGLALIGRYIFLYITDQSGIARNVQSVVLGGTSLSLGFFVFLFGLLADLVATNRALLEETLYRIRRAETQNTKAKLNA